METPLVDAAAHSTHSTHNRKTVVVFGASWCKPGSELYEESVSLGRSIAAGGFKLVNGGYSGTMEGTAKGAAEVPGSLREGVIVPSLFPHRYTGGNEYLTSTVPSATLLQRIEAMTEAADYFVIMAGTLGTLAETALIWNLAALGVGTPLILAYRNPWEKVLTTVSEALSLPQEHRDRIRFVSNHVEAFAAIEAEHRRRQQEGHSSGIGGAGSMPLAWAGPQGSN